MTTEQALTQIEQLRNEKMGWGRIARDLGFKLGPVISKVERSETVARAADRQENTAGAEREGRLDRPERPAKPERPGR